MEWVRFLCNELAAGKIASQSFMKFQPFLDITLLRSIIYNKQTAAPLSYLQLAIHVYNISKVFEGTQIQMKPIFKSLHKLN